MSFSRSLKRVWQLVKLRRSGCSYSLAMCDAEMQSPQRLSATSIFGGEGAVWRAIVGVMFILSIGNAFILLGINSEFETLAEGLLILAAVSLDQLVRRRK